MCPTRAPLVQGSAISCRGLSKSFGSVRALDDLALEVPKGTLLGLLGPNGAGKTTLLRILLGLTPKTSGQASVLGMAVPSPAILPKVGYMPQNLAIYTDLKVRQNLALFARLQGVRPPVLARRAAEVLNLVHLTDRAESRVSELSGGMQRRVSLAASLLADPELLLLDEPTVGVDPELRAEFWDHFQALSNVGKTIVMTTHYMEEATRCDRVVMLHAGKLLEDGLPKEIKARTGVVSMDDAFLVLVRERERAEAGATGGR